MLSMNNHLHILEPYTNLFRVVQTSEVENALADLLTVFLDKIYNAQHRHFDLYFKQDWTSVVEMNSYGHDIEGSWLIYEAAEVLAEHAKDHDRANALLSRAKGVAVQMAQAVLSDGLESTSGAVFDTGDRSGKIIEPKRVWWAQAEGIVGFVNAFELCGDTAFIDAAERIWRYIDAQIIDHEGGEWFGTALDSPDDENTGFKVNAWKCPYHNSRAALELFTRANAA
jgi:mannobiose 2-epimerase